jgi:hypothetical protein
VLAPLQRGKRKTEQAQQTQRRHVQFKRKGTNLDGALGVVLTALALQLQHNLLSGFCLKKVTKLAHHTAASYLHKMFTLERHIIRRWH